MGFTENSKNFLSVYLFAYSKLVGDTVNVPQVPTVICVCLFLVFGAVQINKTTTQSYQADCVKFLVLKSTKCYSFVFLKTVMECFKTKTFLCLNQNYWNLMVCFMVFYRSISI